MTTVPVHEAASVSPGYADILRWFETVTGRPADVVRDPDGVLRFRPNPLVRWLVDEAEVKMNAMAVAYQNGQFGVAEYAAFVAGLGYSLSGFGDLSAFADEIWAAHGWGNDCLPPPVLPPVVGPRVPGERPHEGDEHI
jgi:hypothetical protein